MTELEEITIEYEKLNPEKARAAQTQLAELTQILSQSLAKNADQDIASLTAAHAMQDESLVVLPRHMVNSIEEQLKDYKAAARNLAKHLEAIQNLTERHADFFMGGMATDIRKHCEAANVMEAL